MQETTQQSKTVRIPMSPHYNDERFADKGEVEIWGEYVEGILYEYSDRFESYDKTRHKVSISYANTVAPQSTVSWLEAYITCYEEKPVEVFHVYAGIFPQNGHSYWVAGYKEK